MDNSDMVERVRIVEAIDMLCEQLGIDDKTKVREMLMRPTYVEVELYLYDDTGTKILQPDGEALTLRKTIEVWT